LLHRQIYKSIVKYAGSLEYTQIIHCMKQANSVILL